MVDCEGWMLGSLPGQYMHTCDILHRGVGLIIAMDEDQSSKGGRTPMVYMHRRTTMKCIFLSLYNMFVGGVSSRGEGAKITAAQEVAEKLGLRRTTDFVFGKGRGETMTAGENDLLLEKLFKCTVCTVYNRCIMAMFTYTMCDGENITWQEEEVAWGNYVPYKIVELAADESVDWLLKRGDWTGSNRGNDIAPKPAVALTWDHNDRLSIHLSEAAAHQKILKQFLYVRTLGYTSYSKNGQNEQKQKSLCTKAHWDTQLAYTMVLSDVQSY
jgi:hypothetical protein